MSGNSIEPSGCSATRRRGFADRADVGSDEREGAPDAVFPPTLRETPVLKCAALATLECSCAGAVLLRSHRVPVVLRPRPKHSHRAHPTSAAGLRCILPCVEPSDGLRDLSDLGRSCASRSRRERRLQTAHQIIKLLRRSIDIQHRIFRVGREEQRKTVRTHLDMRVAVRVGARDMDAWEIDSHIRHVAHRSWAAVDVRPPRRRRDE
jgi:hypothetical protein